jgi:hypothetical protein
LKLKLKLKLIFFLKKSKMFKKIEPIAQCVDHNFWSNLFFLKKSKMFKKFEPIAQCVVHNFWSNLSHINLIFGLFVTYGLDQVNLKTVDQSCVISKQILLRQ